jgi:hypothetical protein
MEDKSGPFARITAVMARTGQARCHFGITVRMTRAARRAVLPCVVAGVLVMAGCSESASPPPTDPPVAAQNRLDRIVVLLVQCFADHNLIPASALSAGLTGNPPSDSSTWLHDGKVTQNSRFGDWYSNTGSAVAVDGKAIVNWAAGVARNAKTWPSSICGHMPSIGS